MVLKITQYIAAALRQAKYELLPEDGTYYGSIPGFQGVWANAKTLEDCRDELAGVFEEWMLFRVSKGLPLPVVGGIELAIKETV